MRLSWVDVRDVFSLNTDAPKHCPPGDPFFIVLKKRRLLLMTATTGIQNWLRPMWNSTKTPASRSVYSLWWLVTGWLIAILVPGLANADQAVDCTGVFTDGVSSYNLGTIAFGNDAQLIGSPDGLLRAGRIESNNGSKLETCGDRACDFDRREGVAVSPDTFPDFSVPKNNDLKLKPRESGSLGLSGNRYDEVSTKSRSELSVSGEYSTYYIKQLSLGSKSNLNLVAGDYYIKDFSTGANVTINVVGEGTARLFVKNKLTFEPQVLVNSPGIDQGGDVSKLLIVGYDDIWLKNGSTVSGAVFAFGNVLLNPSTYLYGAASAQDISLKKGARIYYDAGVGEVCGGQSSVDVSHFRIYHPASALTCQASSTISVLACADEACTSKVDESIAVSLLPSGGWAPGTEIDLTGQQDLSLRVTTPTVVTLGLQTEAVDVSGSPEVQCYLAGSEQPSDCRLRFAEAGFLIGESRTLIAGAPEQTVPVSAVRMDDPGQACVPAFAGVTRTVSIGAQPITPSASDASVLPPVLVNSQSVELADDDVETMALWFDDTATTYLDLQYFEAGSFRLDLLYEGLPGSEDEGLEMAGQGEFVSIPAGFCVRATGARDCSDPFASCDAFTSAGSPFELTVEAVQWQYAGEVGPAFCEGNALTRNFAAELTLDHSLVAPEGDSGELGLTRVALKNGRGSLAAQTFSEVGVIRIGVPQGQNYLGASLPGAYSDVIGRFFPYRFETEVLDPGLLGPPASSSSGCGVQRGWVYTGEPFEWELTPEWRITPLNANDLPVKNYAGTEFQKLAPNDVIPASLPATESRQKDLNGDPVLLNGTWYTGDLQADGTNLIYQFSLDDHFNYSKSPHMRLAPFTPQPVMAVDRIEDSDGVSDSGLPDEFSPGASVDIRYGRVRLGSTHGPATSDLALPVTVEVIEAGGNFQLHLEENCLVLSGDDFAVFDMPYEGFTSLTLPTNVFQGGHLQGHLGAPGEGNPGTVSIGLDLSEVPWLRGLWGDDENYSDPEATATFGVYRGHDRIIDWQEVVR